MESSKDEALKRIQKQTAMYHLFRSYAQVEGDKLKEIVARLVDDIAPCKAGDYVRTLWHSNKDGNNEIKLVTYK